MGSEEGLRLVLVTIIVVLCIRSLVFVFVVEHIITICGQFDINFNNLAFLQWRNLT